MLKRHFKDRAFTLVSSIANAMGNPRRLEILELLTNAPKNVDTIAKECRITTANASQHLQRLKRVNLVKTRKQQTTIFYSLTNPRLTDLILALHALAHEQVHELDDLLETFRKDYGTTDSSGQEVESTAADAQLIDVRPIDEFEWDHHPHAISIPMKHLSKRCSRLDASKLVVVYCRGELCTLADEAVHFLISKGFNAVRLNDYLYQSA